MTRAATTSISRTMHGVLIYLEEGRAADFWLRTQARSNTITALRERGYIRFYPYGDRGRGSWGITPEGREALAAYRRKGLEELRKRNHEST